MKCSEIEDKLNAYIDGLLQNDERGNVEKHCAECTNCRHSLEGLKRTKEILGDLDEIEPPAWLTEKVMSRIHEKEEARGWLSRLFLPLRVKVPLEALAMVFVAVLSVYIYRSAVTDMDRFDRPPQGPPSAAQNMSEKTQAARSGEEDIRKEKEPGQKEKKIAAPAGKPQRPALKEIPGPPAGVRAQDKAARMETPERGGPPAAIEKRAATGSLKDEFASPAAIPPSPAEIERSRAKAMAARGEQFSQYRTAVTGPAQGELNRITVKADDASEALRKVRSIMSDLSAREIHESTGKGPAIISCLVDPKSMPQLKDRIAAAVPVIESRIRPVAAGDTVPQFVEVVVISP